MGTRTQISKVEIFGLFGRFKFDIDLTLAENEITILTAPNGYGKSTILKIVQSFASGDYFYFIREKFTRIRIHLTGRGVLEIFRADGDGEGQVTFSLGSLQSKIKDPFTEADSNGASFVVERNFPYLTRIGPEAWRHDQTGEFLDASAILARYGSHPALRRRLKRDAWLEEIRRSLSVFTISTNRLKSEMVVDPRHVAGGRRDPLMVDLISKTIQERMQGAILHQFEVGRDKEATFPARLIYALKTKVSPSEESVAKLIGTVRGYEDWYSRLGLVPRSSTTAQLSNAEAAESAGLLVLATYLEDVREKFALLQDLAERLDVFLKALNELVAFKHIQTSAEEGLIVEVENGAHRTRISLGSLSSGEQHLLVLVGKLLFETEPGSLVLIDEPEISFHPEWQERFLGILENIRRVNNFSALIATHSPILIGDRWDTVIELAEQYRSQSNAHEHASQVQE